MGLYPSSSCKQTGCLNIRLLRGWKCAEGLRSYPDNGEGRCLEHNRGKRDAMQRRKIYIRLSNETKQVWILQRLQEDAR